MQTTLSIMIVDDPAKSPSADDVPWTNGMMGLYIVAVGGVTDLIQNYFFIGLVKKLKHGFNLFNRISFQ